MSKTKQTPSRRCAVPSGSPCVIRTFGDVGEPKIRTHLQGIGDSYTLCGLDTAGDDEVHEKPPQCAPRGTRITCEHCKDVIAIVRDYLAKQ